MKDHQNVTDHYTGEGGQHYYDSYQMRRSDIVDQHKADFFASHISPDETVLDFGCGRGGILSKIPCAKRYALEINPASAKDARANGLEVFSDPKDIPDNLVDVVICA